MVLRSLAITLLVLLLIGSATAQDDAGARYTQTLSCSLSLPVHAGCFYERVGLSLFGAELAYGIDSRFYPDPYLAPYLVLGWYRDFYSVTLEVLMPELQGVPLLGSPEGVLSVTTTYRW